MAFRNHSFAYERKWYVPYPTTGIATLPLIREENEINIRFVFDNLIQLVDEYAEAHKEEMEVAMDAADFELLPRQWAYDELGDKITKHFWVDREFMPPRTRIMRVWNRVAQNMMSFPPYAQPRTIFETVNVFRFSHLACKGFEFLFEKHHRMMGVKVRRPSIPVGCSPFSIFPHSEEDGRNWYHPETHARMIELFYILLGTTEYFFGCIYHSTTTTVYKHIHSLSKISFRDEERWTGFVSFDLHILDIHGNVRSRENVICRFSIVRLPGPSIRSRRV